MFEKQNQNQGTVKQWDDVKGYGFIVPDSGGPDVFVHFREITDTERGERRSLRKGQRVEFTAFRDAKGVKATDVRRL